MEAWQLWLMFLINICLIIGFGWKAILVLVSFRDEVRDLVRAVGTEHPATGFFADLENLWAEIKSLKREQNYQRDALIQVCIKDGVPPPGGRS